MDEKKFEELLLKNNKILLNAVDKKIGENNTKLLNDVDEKIKNNNTELLNAMDEKIKNNNTELLNAMDEKIKNNNTELLNAMDEKIEKNNTKFLNVMDKKFKEIEQKRIDDNFYFEHTYGEKISAIFDKLQMIEENSKLKSIETRKIKEKIERNSTVLMSHDFRISQLEKNINS